MALMGSQRLYRRLVLGPPLHLFVSTPASLLIIDFFGAYTDLPMGQLAKDFAYCRPGIASWWLGIFLLGDFTTLDWVARYLETLYFLLNYTILTTRFAPVTISTIKPKSSISKPKIFCMFANPIRMNVSEPGWIGLTTIPQKY